MNIGSLSTICDRQLCYHAKRASFCDLNESGRVPTSWSMWRKFFCHRLCHELWTCRERWPLSYWRGTESDQSRLGASKREACQVKMTFCFTIQFEVENLQNFCFTGNLFSKLFFIIKMLKVFSNDKVQWRVGCLKLQIRRIFCLFFNYSGLDFFVRNSGNQYFNDKGWQ